MEDFKLIQLEPVQLAFVFELSVAQSLTELGMFDHLQVDFVKVVVV